MPSKRSKTKAMCADNDQFPLSASRPFCGFCLREPSTLNIQTYLAGLDPTKSATKPGAIPFFSRTAIQGRCDSADWPLQHRWSWLEDHAHEL